MLRQAIREAAAGKLRWPLFITGNPGTGKTCGALCVVDHTEGSEFWIWDEYWRFVNDVNFGRAQTIIQGGKDPDGWDHPSRMIDWTTQKWWAYVERLPLLVLDDIGLRGVANDTQYEAMKLTLDRRHNLPTILTSNLDVVKIAEVFDYRVMDRIDSGTTVHIKGTSRR